MWSAWHSTWHLVRAKSDGNGDGGGSDGGIRVYVGSGQESWGLDKACVFDCLFIHLTILQTLNTNRILF